MFAHYSRYGAFASGYAACQSHNKHFRELFIYLRLENTTNLSSIQSIHLERVQLRFGGLSKC